MAGSFERPSAKAKAKATAAKFTTGATAAKDDAKFAVRLPKAYVNAISGTAKLRGMNLKEFTIKAFAAAGVVFPEDADAPTPR